MSKGQGPWFHWPAWTSAMSQEYIDTGQVTHDEPGQHEHECAAGSLHAGELSIENPCICRCGAKYVSVDEDVWFDEKEASDAELV
jgi:hypothetical protein